MQKYKSCILLLIILLVCFLLLSYKIDQVPNAVYHDEATTGVNAYSILKTGKDEYGKTFPLAFRFFGSYTPPLYTYLTVIPISILGLNEFSVRIISVLAGVLMLLVVFRFLNQTNLINKKIAYLLLLLFIITPWNFFFSRTGYEIYLGFSLFSLGSLFCLYGLNNRMALIAGFSILSISTYASHPQMYSAPVFILGFLILFVKKFDIKNIFTGLFIALLIQIPHLLLLNTSAFINKGDLFYMQEIVQNSQKIPLPFFISIPLSFLFSFSARIISYFSPHALFFISDPDLQRSIPELSVFYNWMVIPYLTGIYMLIKNVKDNFVKFTILLILTTVLPASLTGDTFSTQRSLSLLLPLFLIICLGLSFIYEKIGTKLFLPCFSILFLISWILLWRSYFVLLPAERFKAWGFGYKEIAKFISENPNENFLVEQIEDKPSYIELAFFLKTDPQVLQNSADKNIKENYYNSKKFNPNYILGNVESRNIDWKRDIYKNQILIGDTLSVSTDQAKEHFLEEVLIIKDPKQNIIIRGYKTNPLKKCQFTKNYSPFCKLNPYGTIYR